MRGLQDLLAEYDESHGHRVNKLLHWICVPLITFSLLGLLWRIQLPVLNAAQAFMLAAMIYYLQLSPRLGAGMLLVAACLLGLLQGMDSAGLPILWIAAAIFILAWAGQFIGHFLEGKRPSFFRDIQFLLIGPLWLLAAIYRRLGISY
jgi:uncharacterized membrane protein YGL010W